MLAIGVGMSADSGVPTYRNPDGFWRACPPFLSLGLEPRDFSTPALLDDDPQLAWGFYAHQAWLFRDADPHVGHRVLEDWSRTRPTLVYTSNVDRLLARAGVHARVSFEVHGSMAWLQCSEPCSDEVWSAEGLEVEVDLRDLRPSVSYPSAHEVRSRVRTSGCSRTAASRGRARGGSSMPTRPTCAR